MHPTIILTACGALALLCGGWWLGRAAVLAGRGRAPVWTLIEASLGLAVLAVGVAALALAAGLRAYDVFTRETLIVRIHCVPTTQARRFRLYYQPVQGPSTDYLLDGDQWAIDGEILKWDPRLLLLGFQTLQKPTRISGRYADLAQHTAHAPTAYALNGGVDLTWRLLQAAGRTWPGVEAVYGNSAYVGVEPGTLYGVYVTPSGYLIKPEARP